MKGSGRPLFAIVGAAFVFASAAAAGPALPVTSRNSALTLTIEGVRTEARYGSHHAPAGRQYLVLASRWESHIDPKLAEARGLASSYSIENLAEHLFAIVDGQFLGELKPSLDDGTGRRSLGGVALPRPGARVAGNIVYEIPAREPASIDLRFYDDTTGDMTLAVTGPAPEVKPFGPVQSNQIGDFEVFAFENPARGVNAPPGCRALAVELRGRSTWTAEKDAPQYDASVEPGTRTRRVNLLDWPELGDYLYVLADGCYACRATEGSPAQLRFIPEFFTGARFVYFVPAEAHSLELVAEMPHADTSEGVIDLKPLVFPLAGQAASIPFKGGLSITDQMFAVTLNARRSARFGTEPAGEGKSFLVLDVGVTNTGETGEFFLPGEQLLIADNDGSEIGPDDVTARGPHPPGDKVHLPPHSFRRFEIAYRIDEAVKAPKLSFHGGEFMKQFPLTLSP